MRFRSSILLAVALLAPAWRAGDVAAAELGTAPHFLKLADRERVVLFSDGPIAGALADHRADGSIVVMVPKVGAGAAIAGREFDDAASGGSGGTKVRVTSDAQGDARIEIRAAGPVASVRAYATAKPSRLTIDLLRAGAQDGPPDGAPGAAKGTIGAPASAAPKAESKAPPVAANDARPAPSSDAAPQKAAALDAAAQHGGTLPVVGAKNAAAPGTPPASDPPAAIRTKGAPAPAAAVAKPETAAVDQAKSDTAPASEAHPADVAPAAAGKDVAPAASDDTRDVPALAVTPPVIAQAPAPSPSPAVSAKDKGKRKGKAATAAAGAPASAPAAAAASAVTGPVSHVPGAAMVPVAPGTAATAPATSATLVCRWRRVAGVPYCGPDPKAGIYAADLGTAEIAGLLDRGRSGATLVRLPEHGPAEAHLNADVALVHAGKTGYLLPVLAEYEQALRLYPNFADATRSRANVALIYHSLGFAPELARLSRANDVVAPFAAVLLADLWRDRGEQHDLTPLLATGRRAGGITNCLAERVAANVAADQGRAAAFPAAFSDLSKVCPRTILEDSETAWLRGRAMLLGGEAKRASEVLPILEEELPRRERPLLLVDVIAAQDAAGDAKAARRTQERLAGGTLGRRAARDARLALAARDAAEGKVGNIAGRFADMPIEDAMQSRERADEIAVGELLRSGKEIAALGMMTERKVEARSLAPADQLLLARALRKVGLLDQSRRVLAGIGAATTGRLPDGYYEELGALALAHDDAPGALDVAEQWKVARAGNAPPGAVALEARAHAAKGDAGGAIEALEKRLVPLDPVLGRDVAVELAGQLRTADPAVALRLAQGALADSALPPLEPAREAEALSALADAAEATGDKAAAQAAFTRLASEHASEPAAAGAAYRAARLAAVAPAAPAGAAAPAQQGAAKAPAAAPIADDDALSRRLAAAGQVYAEVVAGMQGTKP